MTSYDEIEDEDQLHEMMTKVENFEERKKIRNRIREIREKKLHDGKSEAKPAAAASTPETPSKTGDANKENIDTKEADSEKEQKVETPSTTTEGTQENGIENIEQPSAKAEDKKEDIKEPVQNEEQASDKKEDVKDSDIKNEDQISDKAEDKKEDEADKTKEGEDIKEKPEAKKDASAEKGKEEAKTEDTSEDKKDGAVEKAKEDDGTPKETTETSSVTSKDGKTTTVTTVQTITDKTETRIITTEVTTKTMADGGTSTKTSKRTKIIQNQAGPGGAMAAPGGLAPGGRGRGVTRSPSAIKQMLLEWTKAMTQEYSDKILITNFSSSWNNGLAFCALIHHFYPDSFDFDALDPKKRRYNFDLAFDTAEKVADIAPLLDTDDMVRMKNPDWKCVFTYVQSFYRKLQSHERNKALPKPQAS